MISLVLTLLIACGSDDKDTAGSDTSTSTPVDTSDTAAPEDTSDTSEAQDSAQ